MEKKYIEFRKCHNKTCLEKACLSYHIKKEKRVIWLCEKCYDRFLWIDKLNKK